METETKTTSRKRIVIGVIVALLLINGVTAYFLFTNVDQKETLIVQKTEVEQKFTALEEEYNATTAMLDASSIEIGSLKGRNSELDAAIAEKQAMIEEEKQKLEEAYANNTLTAGNLKQARMMISQYELTIKELQGTVEEYKVQTVALNENLSCEKEFNTQLVSTNTALTTKIKTASVLDISQVNVEAVKRNYKGNEVPVSKAKAAENLKISFETGANKALDPGTLNLYVRIVNPKGETIAVSERGSGIIPGTEETKPVQYTKEAKVQWTQKNKKVVVYWGRYIQDPGTYKVELYQEGKVIGKGMVRLS